MASRENQIEALERLAAEHGLLEEENSGHADVAAPIGASSSAAKDGQNNLKQNGSNGEPPSPPPFDPLPVLNDLQLYWLDGSSSYYMQRPQGQHLRFVELGTSELKRKLRRMGFRSKPEPERGEFISQIDTILDAATELHVVDSTVNIAGTAAGIYDWPGGKVLVRESPRLITPRPGLFPVINEFLNGLLGHDGALRLRCWLKIAFEALRRRERRPGQALILIGPPDCGKSRIQHEIITPILAGRSADPKSYFAGRTDFNAELVGAEHLLIEEIPSSSRHDERLFFGERVKEVVANATVRLHAKNRNAVTVPPFWRLSISLNDNREKLRCLPPLAEDLADKIIMLEAKPMPEFWMQFSSADDPRKAFRDAIEADLPAFAHHLLTMSIPEELKDRRFGVKSFIPEELAQLLFEGEPEYHLWLLIEKGLFPDNWDHKRWQGDAEDLKQALCSESSPVRVSAARLLSSVNVVVNIGIWLTQLQKRFPARIERPPRTARERPWIIHPPTP